MSLSEKQILNLVKNSGLFKAHPWHGVELWSDQEKNILNAYIEIVPEDRIKYEVDKKSGILKVDRPQKYSNVFPCLYGFIPKTYSDKLSAEFANNALGRDDLVGDNDPVDICVLTDRTINHGDILLEAIPIGGFRMIDKNEVDDKLIAVLKNDLTYGHIQDLSEISPKFLESLRHYFLTYKDIPGANARKVEITDMYDQKTALKVIAKGQKDYQNHFDK